MEAVTALPDHGCHSISTRAAGRGSDKKRCHGIARTGRRGRIRCLSSTKRDLRTTTLYMKCGCLKVETSGKRVFAENFRQIGSPLINVREFGSPTCCATAKVRG